MRDLRSEMDEVAGRVRESFRSEGPLMLLCAVRGLDTWVRGGEWVER